VLATVSFVYFPARSYLKNTKARVVEVLNEALQNSVTLEIGKIRISLYKGLGFRLHDMVVREKEGAQREIFSAESFFVGLDFRSLLAGEVRFVKLIVHRPRAILTRDAAGRLNVEGLFSQRYAREHLPAGMEDVTLARTFGPLLWRDEVSLEEAEILFRDLTKMDEEVLRVSGVNLRVRNHLDSDSLWVELSGTLSAPVHAGSFTLQGEIKGWRKAHRVSELIASVSLDFQGVDLEGSAGLFGLGPEDRTAGRLGGRVYYDGQLLLPGKARVELQVDDACLQSERVQTKPLSLQRLGLAVSVEAGSDRVSFSDGILDLDRIRLAWGGNLALAQGSVSFIDLFFEGEGLALVKAKEFLPLRLLRGKAWPFLVAMTRGGQVDVRSRLKGTPANFSHMSSPDGEKALYLWIRFQDATVLFPIQEPYLPFESVSGVLELVDGTIFFRDFHASYGRSSIPEIGGTILGIHQAQKQLEIKAHAQLDMPETVRELEHGIFPQGLRDFARDIKEVSGSASLAIGLNYAFGKAVDEVLHLKGESTLHNVSCRHAGLRLGLQDVNGTLAFSESSVSAINMKTLLGTSAVQAQGHILFASGDCEAQGRLFLSGEEVQARDLLALLGRAEELTGRLRGRVEIGWQGRAVAWSGELEGDRFDLATPSYLFSGEKLALRIDGKPGSVALQDLRCSFEGNPISLSGRWTSLSPPVGEIELQSPALDLASVLRKKKAVQPWEKIMRRDEGEQPNPERFRGVDLKVGVHCDTFLHKSVRLDNLELKGSVQSGMLVLERVTALAGQGQIAAKGEFDLKRSRMPYKILYSMSNLRADELFRWFSVIKDVLDGPLFLEGDLTGEVRPAGTMLGALAGRISVYSGACTVQRYEILSKLLTLVNFTQWSRLQLSDLNTVGVPCREIKGDFHIERGTLTTDNLFIDSSVALVQVEGRYDFINDGLDLDLTLKPTEPLDQVVDKLPLVNYVISGPDGTVVVFNYHIQGPLKDPDIRLVPLQALGDRISDPLRKLNDLYQYLRERVVP